MIELHKSVQGAARLTDLGDVLSAFLQAFSLTRYIYVFMPSRSLDDPLFREMHSVGYDDHPEIMTSCNDYLSTPTNISYIRRSLVGFAGPFYGTDFLFSHGNDGANHSLISFPSTAAKIGLVIPLIGPQSFLGFISIAADPEDLTPVQVREINTLSYAIFHRHCELWRQTHEQRIVLNEREAEVLRWLATGKSNDVIGEIIGVSKHTVDSYIRRLFLKLSVNDRVSAAVKSTEMGLLSTIYPREDNTTPIYYADNLTP